MARDNVALETDVAGKPVPQYRGPAEYEKLLGRNGASRVELYGADGQPVSLEVLLATTNTRLASILAAIGSTLDTEDATLAGKIDALLALIGEVGPNPTADTVLARLKDLLAELESQHYDTSEPQNTTLTPGGPATELTFTAECAYFDIFNEGPGDAWVKVDGTATIAGAGCFKALAEVGYSLKQRGTVVSAIGASASVVQVVGVR